MNGVNAGEPTPLPVAEPRHQSFFLIPFFILILSSFAFATEEPVVRVAILQGVPSIRVTVPTPCRLIDFATGKVVGEGKHLLWQQVEPSNSGLKIGSEEFPSKAVLLEPKEPGVVKVNARSYRGSLLLLRDSAGKLTVVNRIGLEEYLVSALASETHPDWPIEVLKAHAVVSRTMIAHRMWISRERPFDVTADTSTHLYYGVSVEREWARRAVQETRDQVLAYERELFSATFHANCGGHTEDAWELWQVKGNPEPLKGRPDPYCKDRRHYRWRKALSWRDFIEAVSPDAQGIGDIRGCRVVERNDSGRVRAVRLEGSMGTLVLSGKRFRELLGPNRLRSLKFSISSSRWGIFFDGYGWGHGVGLCQWGAYGMAREGHPMDAILSFYFPGAQRRKLRGLPGFTL